jgi:arsenate reductase
VKEEFIIYHNPRCRKSREALNYLQDEGIEPKVVKYLDEPPSPEELKKILAKMNSGPEVIIRREERIFKEKFKERNFTDEEWLILLHENPKLIQRPIVIKGNKAVLGRPLENVKNLLS